MRLAQDTARLQPRAIVAPSIGEATAVRDAASGGAAANEAVAVVTGGDGSSIADLVNDVRTIRDRLDNADIP